MPETNYDEMVRLANQASDTQTVPSSFLDLLRRGASSDLPTPIKRYLGIKGLQGSMLGALFSAGGDPRAEAESVFMGGDYNPVPALLSSVGMVGAPAVGPAGIGTLGSGVLRKVSPKAFREAPLAEAPFPQYATNYPEPGVPVELPKTDPKKAGQTYLSKTRRPKARPSWPSARESWTIWPRAINPTTTRQNALTSTLASIPGANVDTLSIVPKKPATINEYLDAVGANETAKNFREALKAGQDLGGAEKWYAMGQLEADFIKELGPKAGRGLSGTVCRTHGGHDIRQSANQ